MEMNKEQQEACKAFVKASMDEKDKIIIQEFRSFNERIDRMESQLNNISKIVQDAGDNIISIITVICRIESLLNSRPIKNPKGSKIKTDEAILDDRIDKYCITSRCRNCLRNANIILMRDLVTKKEKDILEIPNMGRRMLREINELLDSCNLKLGMTFDD